MTKWEFVAEGLERIAVPGGWLYRSFYRNHGMDFDIVTAPVFVPALPSSV
jgi:hypothetical protein